PEYEHLLGQMAEGDTVALEALYNRTKSAVYGFALSIVKNPQEAEDIMQDTYIRLFQSAGGYRAQGKPMAWILTIVRNLALMRLRDGKKAAPPIDEMPTLSDGQDFTEGSIDRMVLRTALAHLSEEERQIVMLHSVAGLKHREIGEIMQIPLSTTLSKYRRALAKLKNLIKEETA
ncbi:RNA polymerase sigma factor, partial [Ruminococcaceae bacterium OttesenSCG-928-L11]|nr:RNA polymerase sigma factor [Ruminococcaceae bacterium OttesenSCG-928-L11]